MRSSRSGSSSEAARPSGVIVSSRKYVAIAVSSSPAHSDRSRADRRSPADVAIATEYHRGAQAAANAAAEGAAMRFGGFSFGSWHESESHGEVLAQLVELAVQSDRLGLDSFWLGEHHFSRHGILADTMVMAAHIAARTEHIRIGTAVIVLPLHNPVRVAEQVAIVDHLSGGRVDVGVGIGYQQREFAGLGVDIDEARARFIESLDVMVRAWTDEPLVYEGEHVRIAAEDAITVYPKPLQQPHPPLYQAVSTTPASIDLAASRGLPVIVGGPTDVLGRAPEVIAHWRERMRAHGRDPEGHDLPCL
ncbi:MAG: LLM class flavin-dependent oxidoreductase, partial [Chloroflexi bacterium]|nr:LLM class flavin-dependent oxidoreductase [Chloroflexota bacterium]